MTNWLFLSHYLFLLELLTLIVRLPKKPMVAASTEPVTSCARSNIRGFIIWHKHFIGAAEAIFKYLRLSLSHFNAESIACGRLPTVLR